jgi:hypothetical protein
MKLFKTFKIFLILFVERKGIEPCSSEQLAKLFGHACTTPPFERNVGIKPRLLLGRQTLYH